MRRFHRFPVMLTGTALAGIVAILAVTTLPSPVPARSVPALDLAMSMSVSDRQLSSAELVAPGRNWEVLGDAPVTAHAQYAYVRMVLENTGSEDLSLVIQNDTRNYYTALLAFNGREYIARYRQGDPVPAKESPLRHIRAAFPVTLRSGGSDTFILEYMNERDIVLDPDVRSAAEWFSLAGAERDIVLLISASVLCLILINLIAGLSLFRPELIRMSFLSFSLLFFFARQSRLLLLLINPLPYTNWLFPLSIGFELVSAHVFFGALMGKNFLPWQHWAYRILSGLTVALVIASFFGAAYTIGDILNVLAMITLLIVVIGVLNALRNHDYGVLQIMLAFAPWILMMAVEIVIIYIKPRQIFLADYRQAFGMLFSLILVTVTSIRNREREGNENMERLTAELAEAKRGIQRDELAVREDRARYRARLAADCETPLAGIFAAIGTLQREYSDPGVIAAADVIVTEAARIGDTLGSRDPAKGGLL